MVGALDARELRAVLLHEAHHLEQRDPLKVLASRMVAGALFLLPVAAELRDRYLVAKELSADAHVVKELSPAPLAGALLKICRGAGQRQAPALAAAAVGPFNVVGERIRHLADPSREPRRPLPPRRLALSLAAAAAVLVLSAGSTFAAGGSLPAGKSCCGSTALCDTAPGGDRVGQH
jgi:beta-lactamase regulating signal transducer with metallopeptidase domain